MCDTLVAGPNAAADGAVWFAKNSDREPGEAQVVEIHPGREHTPGSTLQCTHVQVPQAKHTFQVLLSRPVWMWGAEMGANEHGLAIGNEAVFTRFPVPRVGLTGMDLVRLALERCRGASEAVDFMIEMVGRYGQGGGCGFRNRRFRYFSSFAIVDPREAWILETAGPFWAAERVHGLRTISNALSTGDGFDRMHPDAYTYARRKGWCGSARDFQFARCFADRRYGILSGAAARAQCTRRHLQAAGDGLSSGAVFAALRDHNGRAPAAGLTMTSPCAHAHWSPARRTGQTTGSMVSRLLPTGSSHWLTGTSSPCLSVFKPVPLGSEPLDTGTAAGEGYDGRSLFWLHERLHRRVMLSHETLAPALEPDLAMLQERAVAASGDPAGEAQRVWDEHLGLLTEWVERVEGYGAPVTASAPLRAYWARQCRLDGIPAMGAVLEPTPTTARTE